MANFKTSAIIPAAGSGKRLDKKQKKQYLEIRDKPLLYYPLEVFHRSEKIDEIVIVVPREDIERTEENIVKRYDFNKVKCVVEGGAERQDSVKKGFENISDDTDVIVIHDAARPVINPRLIESVIMSAIDNDCAITAVPVTDTLKMAVDGVVKNTFPRENFWRSQTPQAFRYEVLFECYEKKLDEDAVFTDEAQIAEYAGFQVAIVEGSEQNIKITDINDFKLAEYLLKESNV